MKRILFIFGMATAVIGFQANMSIAQEYSSNCAQNGCADAGCKGSGCHAGKLSHVAKSRMKGGPGIVGEDGFTKPVDTVVKTCPLSTAYWATHDHYSPHPFYAYSNCGIEASWTHEWNKQQASMRPWHGNYSYWRFGAPTALVVPPTAAFHSTYRWGVGQTTSDPIYAQFGVGAPGMGGGGGGMTSPAPYWPSSTNQFGVYPVRAPWN